MLRFLVASSAVATLLAGFARPQPRPAAAWTVDLTEKADTAAHVLRVGYSADGRTLLALTFHARVDQTADILLSGFDTRDRRELYRTRVGNVPHEYRCDPAFALAPGDRVLAATPNGLGLFDCRDGRRVDAPPARPLRWVGVWATNDRRHFLVDYENDKSRLTRGNLPTGPDDPDGWTPHGVAALTPRKTGDPACEIDRAAVSPDGRLVAVSEIGADRDTDALALYQVKPGVALSFELVARVATRHPELPPNRLAFSPDGRTLATGDTDGEAKLWDTAPGRAWAARATVGGRSAPVSDIAFRPDGKALAYTTWEDHKDRPNVHLVDAGAGRVVRSFRTRGVANAAAFSPDGKHLVIGHVEGRVEVWDAGHSVTGR